MRRALVVVACVCVAGCAGIGASRSPPDARGSARTPAGQPVPPRDAVETIAIGKSTKADVSAALGKAIEVPFDSGYEVWVYRWPGAQRTTRAATELVVLFDPSGLATKVRMRPGS
jgi:hypothetical protein